MAVSYYQQHRPREATITVSRDPDYSGDFVCDGVADDVEIQAAIDYVGGLGGGDVYVGIGTYQITATVDIDYDAIFLRGAGWNTVFDVQAGTTIGITVVGTVGTPVEGVFLRDFKVNMPYDNNFEAGIRLNYAEKTWCHNLELDNSKGYGIFVTDDSDFSIFENLYVHDNRLNGIIINDGTSIRVIGCQIIYNEGVGLEFSNAGTHGGAFGNNISFNGVGGIRVAIGDVHIVGNDISNNVEYGINQRTGAGLITGNQMARTGSIDGITIPGGIAIIIDSACAELTISGNQINHTYYGTNNLGTGISVVDSEDIVISGNQIWDLPVDAGAGVDGIFLENSDDVIIVGNEVDTVTGFGINISTASCDGTFVKENKLVNCTLGPINDVGTNTQLAVKTFQFIQGTTFISADGSAKGWEINAEADMAVALGQLPLEVQQVVRFKIWAVALGAPAGAGGQMHLDIIFNAGGSLEAWNLAANSWTLANFDGEEADYVNTDVIHWVVEDGDVGTELSNLLGGDGLELKVNGGTAVAPDGATNATFRAIEIEYV